MPDRNADARGLSIPRTPICPRFDACDPRCGSRTTLGHLDEVFRFCTSDYESCPIFAGSAGGGVTSSSCVAPLDADCEHICPGHIRPAFGSCEGPLSGDLITGAAVAELVRDAVELTIRGVRVFAEGSVGAEGNSGRDARLQHAAPTVHDLCAR